MFPPLMLQDTHVPNPFLITHVTFPECTTHTLAINANPTPDPNTPSASATTTATGTDATIGTANNITSTTCFTATAATTQVHISRIMTPHHIKLDGYGSQALKPAFAPSPVRGSSLSLSLSNPILQNFTFSVDQNTALLIVSSPVQFHHNYHVLLHLGKATSCPHRVVHALLRLAIYVLFD